MRSIKLLSFDEYSNRYGSARMTRERGILEVTFHTDGDSLRWTERSHHELGMIFKCIAADRDNRIVIMTGVGDEWSGPPAQWDARVHRSRPTPEDWDDIIFFGRQLSMSMLEIEAPIIFALNGPPYHHVELPLLADIVIASDDAVFGDVGHFHGGGLVPGDGISIVLSALLGPNRARYLQLMGREVDAKTALEWGLVGEVLPKARVLVRAREIAAQLSVNSDLVLRYTRLVFTQPMKERLLRHQGLGLALEGLAATAETGRYRDSNAEAHLNNGAAAYARQDFAEALKCFKKASYLGSPQAMRRLSDLFAEGLGASQDAAEATYWARKADELYDRP